MNRLSTEKRAEILGRLTEGMSLRAVTRVAGVSINTVSKLLVDIGEACSEYMNEVLVDLPLTRIECDEIWSFCYSKAKKVPVERRGEFGVGDVWTWVAIDADTKLVPSYFVGRRDGYDAYRFMTDLAGRLRDRVQLTSDGFGAYIHAVGDSFINGVDFAQLVKQYKAAPTGEQTRYSPADCTGAHKRAVQGDPDMDLVSTSYVERQNLTMRMNMRRFTRLTNGFSKKVENHAAAVSLHFMVYNFARVHKSLSDPYPRTPAMAAGVADHKWSLVEVAALLD